ncbi:hypothetical protein Bca4012_032134 [Brassica carinata]
MFWILFQAFKNLQILLLRLLLLHSEFVIMFCDVSIRDFTDDVKLLFVVIPLGPVRQRSTSSVRALPGLGTRPNTQYRIW